MTTVQSALARLGLNLCSQDLQISTSLSTISSKLGEEAGREQGVGKPAVQRLMLLLLRGRNSCY